MEHCEASTSIGGVRRVSKRAIASVLLCSQVLMACAPPPTELPAPVPEQEPEFDFTLIDNLHRLVLEGEAGWRAFFDECGVEPFKVIYEDLVESYEKTALRILDYLDVAVPADLVFGERRLRKQADGLNEVWVAQYLEMKAKR